MSGSWYIDIFPKYFSGLWSFLKLNSTIMFPEVSLNYGLICHSIILNNFLFLHFSIEN